MTRLPIKDGKNCVFRVVRVSGTIRKAEEECIQRARELVLKARRETGEKGDSTLDDIFGGTDGNSKAGTTKEKDVLMVDKSESEEEEEETDGDG